MIVIIEGPDGSGKSTLISQLRASTELYCHVLSTSGPPPGFNAVIEELGWLANFPRSLFLICDRYRLISETIYGPILRGKSLVGAFNMHLIAEAEVDAIIYCRPRLETIVENVRRTKAAQLSGIWEHLGEIVQAYDELFDFISDSETRVINYDYEHQNHTQLIKELRGVADGQTSRDIPETI